MRHHLQSDEHPLDSFYRSVRRHRCFATVQRHSDAAPPDISSPLTAHSRQYSSASVAADIINNSSNAASTFSSSSLSWCCLCPISTLEISGTATLLSTVDDARTLQSSTLIGNTVANFQLNVVGASLLHDIAFWFQRDSLRLEGYLCGPFRKVDPHIM